MENTNTRRRLLTISIREAFLLTAIVGLILGWWADRTRLVTSKEMRMGAILVELAKETEQVYAATHDYDQAKRVCGIKGEFNGILDVEIQLSPNEPTARTTF